MDRETTPGPSRPFQRGLLGRAPPGRRPALRLREPAQRMLQRGGGRSGRVPGREARRPGSGSASGLGPGEGPSGRAGSQSGPAGSGLRRFRQPSGGGGGATRQGHSHARLDPGLWLILRTSQTGDPLGSPLSGRQKSYLGWAGSPGARLRGDGLGARPPGCAQEARAWGGSRRRGLLAAAPRPPLQDSRRLRGAAAGAHAQRRCRESQPRPDSDSRVRGRGPPLYFRTVTW